MARSEECEELAKRLRAKWEKRTTLIASQTQELWQVDREAATLFALMQEACGKEAQKIIDEIWKVRI